MKRKILKSCFFDRSSVIVAKDLLGKYLVRDGVAYKIIETEAYEGLEDKASHASRGQTLRNTPMFGPPGTIYVYFTYGIHWMLNIVCGKEGYPSAILIRGVEGCIGPARLTKKLEINKRFNSKVLGRKMGLWIEERIIATSNEARILKTPRIGVEYAGVWAKKLYRFILQ